MNKITSISRQKIADEITLNNIPLGGKLNYADFLNRLYDLDRLPSKDRRYKTAYGDIECHSDWGDYEIAWMFTDDRFNLLHCPDEDFIRFLRETLNPTVCSNDIERQKLKEIYDKYLSIDGFELFEEDNISSIPIYSIRRRLFGADLEEKKDKIKKHLNSEYVRAKIKIMSEAVHTNTDLALGTAKELIETTCKSILKEKKNVVDKNWELARLFKETINQLSFLDPNKTDHPEEATRSIKQILGGFNSIVQGVAELRNTYGTGHGKDQYFKGLPPKYTEFMVAAVSDIIIFILQINGENTEISE